mmetsp:Transcript_34895/g.31418  ORF Transcript_34895/g.31418 Transcript_34895/m.31418 type:complete len:146 (+) Transcript_34895:342-779(+)
MSNKLVSDRVALYFHHNTLLHYERPYGCVAIFAGYDEADGYSLRMVEPSGLCLGYYGCSAGKGKQIAKSHLDKTNFKDMTCKEALKLVAKMLHRAHDEQKGKKLELEISWVCEASKNKHELIPKDLLEKADQEAQDEIEKEETGE